MSEQNELERAVRIVLAELQDEEVIAFNGDFSQRTQSRGAFVEVAVKHLSPLFTRLSQRITEEWEERWSKDASQSERECRARDKRIEELEGAESKWREDFRIQNEHICKSNERIEELEAQAGAMRDAGEWKSLLAELDDEEASHQETLRLWQEAKARVAELEAQAGAMRKALEAIAAGAPTSEPERYEGDNHGDSWSSGYDFCEWSVAKIAREALSGLAGGAS